MAPKPPTLTAPRQSRGAARFRGVLAALARAIFGRRLEAGHVDAGGLQRAADTIANPLGVPPLDRRDRHAVDQDLVVKVVADGEPGRAAAAQLLAFRDGIADLD